MTELEKKAEKYATEDLPDGYTRINLQKKEAYIAGAKELQKEFNEEIEKFENRNAELKGMYAHSAREADTYKQLLELKEKENGVVWHDLRKNPDDLPKKNKLYLVFGYTNKHEMFYELDVFEPTEEEFLGCGENVIAWCEIPKFEEEE